MGYAGLGKVCNLTTAGEQQGLRPRRYPGQAKARPQYADDDERTTRLLAARRKLMALEERLTKLLETFLYTAWKSPTKKKTTSKKPAQSSASTVPDGMLQHMARRHVAGLGAQTLSRMLA